MLDHNFAGWVEQHGLTETWPLTESGKFKRDKSLLKDMAKKFPFLEQLRQCDKTVRHLGKKSLVVDHHTAKHYHPVWPFSSTTARNQPKGWLPGCPKWMRFLAKPKHGCALIYVDFTAQEFALAAAQPLKDKQRRKLRNFFSRDGKFGAYEKDLATMNTPEVARRWPP